MKRDVLKCTAEESRQQVVVVLHGFCEEGKVSKCFSGGPIKDTAGSRLLLTQSTGKWENGEAGILSG